MNVEIVLCLPKEAETVSLVRKAVARTLLLFGVDEDCAQDIELAVSEACTNVVNHAATDDEYEVTITVDEHRCDIRVRNVGEGFDAAALDGVMPSPYSARGRGVAIMHAVMDSVDLTSAREAGTIVHLVRGITARDDGPLVRHRRARHDGSG